eukprot:5169597-Prymnesium_polylepis.1
MGRGSVLRVYGDGGRAQARANEKLCHMYTFHSISCRRAQVTLCVTRQPAALGRVGALRGRHTATTY